MVSFPYGRELSFYFEQNCLFDDINFSLSQGDCVGLMGHNGCGKSTLLKIISGDLTGYTGTLSFGHSCILSRVEQSLPNDIMDISLQASVLDKLPSIQRVSEAWRVQVLLLDMGFAEAQFETKVQHLSGGQQTRLLLARALINEPDLLLLDEPSNHMDLPALLWLEDFLLSWKGTFILVSHDKKLLEKVTKRSWILKDKKLHSFQLAGREALKALKLQEEQQVLQHKAQSQEIDRVEKSAKRLALWGKVYDNENFARKAKSMEKRVDNLKEKRVTLSQGMPWHLELSGEDLRARKILQMKDVSVGYHGQKKPLYTINEQFVKSGDH